MNVTVFACVVGLVFMVKCVCVFRVVGWGGTKDSAQWMPSYINRGAFWQRLVGENIQCTVDLKLWACMGIGLGLSYTSVSLQSVYFLSCIKSSELWLGSNWGF